MISSRCSSNDSQQEQRLYTLVSTFEKKNSLSIKLLFGIPEITRSATYSKEDYFNALEHFFLPGQIFGIELESKGKDYQKFHHVVVLQACHENEQGTIVPGITPGAHVLLQTTNNAASKRLIDLLNKIYIYKYDLTQIMPAKFKKLNDLILLNMKPEFFIGELIGE